MSHTPTVLHKFGEATGLTLKQAACVCGWQAGVWYVRDEFVSQSYALHLRALDNPEAPASMLAQEAGK